MKKFYQVITKVLIVLLVATIPMLSPAQTKTQTQKPETKDAKVKKNPAPSYKYWGVTLFGGVQQFNGDIAKNKWLNPTKDWKPVIGVGVMHQFSRVIGLRVRFAWSQVAGEAGSSTAGKYVGNTYVWETFKSTIISSDLNVTINWLNWILGYKPERLFSSYIIAGVGADHSKGILKDMAQAGTEIGYLGYKDATKKATTPGANTSGIAGWNLEFTPQAGLGFDFNINKHWSISPEFIWKFRDGDVLDMANGGAKAIKQDMYSNATINLTYKFAYTGCSLKEMEKRYSEVKYETTPPVLSEKGDSIQVTVKGTFPQKYFCIGAGMYFQPELKWNGGSYLCKPMHLMGEKVTGDGTMIKYKEGGTFTYSTYIPYKPEMNTSELVVAPTIYETKDKIIPKKDEIKAKGKFLDLPSRDLAPGVIYTPTRIHTNEMLAAVPPHGFLKDITNSKTGTLYFKVNKYDLNLKFGLNNTKPAQDALAELNAFIKQGWQIKSINIDGWASPEGEETFNTGLSENRSKTGNTYMIDQFKSWVKDANKDNKDKKAVKAAMDAAGKDVNFQLAHHGPDWNGFLKNVQASNIKDKDKILNVINSSGDNKKKEQEIRNMILIYPELEENMLPPLRRAEITAVLAAPVKTDAEISQMAISSPDKLRVDELLYAGTLTNDAAQQVTIYENAARLYPDNWKAQVCAGGANLKVNNLDKAGPYLNKAASLSPNNGIVENTFGVYEAKKKNYKAAEDHFKKAQQLGENVNFNLGTLMIPKGDYNKALNLLGNAKCTYNLGLAQLVSGNNSAAETTLKCAPQDPDTYYLLAIVGARTKNTKMLYEYLGKACQNAQLKADAKGDREFYGYENTPEFQSIVK